MSDSFLERIKAENETLLESWGADVNRSLPCIEGLSEVTPKPARDVAKRICALTYVARFGFGAPARDMVRDLNQFGLWDAVSGAEAALLTASSVEKQDLVNCGWLAEGIAALMWVIGRAELHHDRQCDDDLAERVPFRVEPTHFIESASRRSLEEIQRQADLLYRLHWYARNCRFSGKSCNFKEGLVWEHRRAIDWAYGVEGDWDEVPGDT